MLGTIIILLFSCGNWGKEKLSNLSKAKEPISDGERNWNQED